MTKRALLSLALLALSACGGVDDDGGSASMTKGLSAGSCSALFGNHFEVAGSGWSARLTGGIVLGLSTNNVASMASDEGFFEDCGRSDVKGAYVTSYIPFTDDYTMTLYLTSASCGDKTVVITGDCTSSTTGTAGWNGKAATVARIGG